MSKYIDEFGRERIRDELGGDTKEDELTTGDDRNEDRADKRRRERSESRERDGSLDRKRTRRSPTPESRRRQGPDTDSYVPKYDRSSYRRRDRSPLLDDRRQPASDRDSYVPDYERDGYHPAPRHPDHDNGPMGSYGSSFSRGPPNPYKLDYIVSFRQFADYLRQEGIIQAMPKKQDGDKQSEEYEAQTQEIKRRYDIYKENFQHKQLRRFFEYHMDEEWMIERYHPTAPEKEAREKRIKDTKKNLLSKWLNELGAERFDNVLLDEPETKEGQENPVSEDDPDFKDKVELARRTVFIRIVPNMVKKSTVLELVQNIGGFQYLALSEPRQYQLNKPPPTPKPDSRIPVHMDLLSRVGWVVFDSPEDAAKAQKELENKSFPGLKSDDTIHAVYSPDQTINFRYKLTPSDAFGSEDRIKVDLANVKQLVEKLDKVWGCENGGKALKQKIETLLASRRESRNEETDEDRLCDLKLDLDLHITYLRHVHLFCYYSGGIEVDCVEELSRKAGDRVYRRRPVRKSEDQPPLVPLEHTSEDAADTEEKPAEESGETPADAAKTTDDIDDAEARRAERTAAAMARFDTRIELKMDPPSVLSSDITKYGGRDMETEIEKHLENYISKISEAKYKCKICDKLFKEEKFVKKHLNGKHPEKSKKLELEVQYFNAFVIDPHHLSPREPVLQPQVPAFPYQMPYSAPVGAGFFNSGYPAMGGYMPNSFNPGLPYPVVAQGRNHGGYGRGYGGQGYVPGGAGGVHGGGRGKRFHPYGRKQDGRGGNANLPVDPRQIKSYVDLDAPAEAEVQISYD